MQAVIINYFYIVRLNLKKNIYLDGFFKFKRTLYINKKKIYIMVFLYIKLKINIYF
jgi:hypothetical protein